MSFIPQPFIYTCTKHILLLFLTPLCTRFTQAKTRGRFLSSGIILGSPLSCPDLFLYTITLPAVTVAVMHPLPSLILLLNWRQRVLLSSKKPANDLNTKNVFKLYTIPVLHCSPNFVQCTVLVFFHLYVCNSLTYFTTVLFIFLFQPFPPTFLRLRLLYLVFG
jgi:hypothetical protein